jgi:hypothetical protein
MHYFVLSRFFACRAVKSQLIGETRISQKKEAPESTLKHN